MGKCTLALADTTNLCSPAVSHHANGIHLEHAVVGLLIIAIIAKKTIDALYKTDELPRHIIARRIQLTIASSIRLVLVALRR